MTVATKLFDSSVTSPTGDVWLSSFDSSNTFSPIVINPGHSAVVKVTITPAGAKGTVVKGTLYVDDLETNIPPPALSQESGDELAAIPYAYRIK
jgi:hypothetical protein